MSDPRFSTAKWKAFERVPESSELKSLELREHEDEDEEADGALNANDSAEEQHEDNGDDSGHEEAEDGVPATDAPEGGEGEHGEADNLDGEDGADGQLEDAGTDEKDGDAAGGEDAEEDGTEEATDNTAVAEDGSAKPKKKKKSKLKTMTPEEYEQFKEQYNRRGVIYISRIPPFMRPQALKKLMGDYGEVLRIFLTPEDEATRRRRKKSGGNRAIKFSDGWVEFADKKVAKMVAATLNGQPIGGRKRSKWHDDIINVKYLSGFKWHHLTEKIAAARNERATRIRNEMAEAHHAATHYQKQAERSRTRKAIEAKKKRKAGEDDEEEEKAPVRLPKQRRLLDPELAE